MIKCDLRENRYNQVICIKCGKNYGRSANFNIDDNNEPCSYYKQPPSLAKKAINLASSTVKHVSRGMAQAGKKEREKRLEICVSCDRYNAEDKTCLECGCYLETKTKWASEACPIGLWGSTLSRKSSCGGCKKRKNKT